jgi:hypothetical protein
MNHHNRQSDRPAHLRSQKPNRNRAKNGAKRRTAASWVGRDLAPLHRADERRRRFLPVLLIGGLIATLGLTALRIDLIRQRYALAAAMGEEKRLLEEQRALTAQVRSLRDPARLTALAQDMGFVRPASEIHLPTDGVLRRDFRGSDVALGPRP